MSKFGHCRSRPPVPVVIGIAQGVPQIGTYWPQVPDTEACGEWHERTAPTDMKNIDISDIPIAEIEGSA